jgi:PAS domain S-box-containing protein
MDKPGFDSDQLRQAVIEASPTALIALDREGNVRLWNPAAARLFGWTREEVMGRRFPPAPQDHLEQFSSWLDRELRGESFTELELHRKDGSLVKVSIMAAPLSDEPGPASGPNGIMMHLAKRRPTAAEEALAEQSWFLQHLIDTIPSPIFHKNIDGLYLGCNNALGDFLGLPKEEIVGKSVYDVYPKDLADKYHEMDSALFRQPGVQIYDAAMGHADGTRHDVTFYKATYSTIDGTLAGLVGVMIDISDRKRAEAALRESEQKLANIIEFLPDATLVIDGEGRVIAWNKAIEDMTGVKAGEMLGKGNYEYAVPFYGTRRPILIDLVLKPQAVMAEYTEVKREDPALTGVAYFPDLRGTEAYLFGKASPLRDSQGNIIGAIETIRDITDRQRAEAERLKLSKLESLGTLAGGIAHDFNNIITAILGNIGLAILEGRSEGRGLERLGKAEQACLRARGLAQQLLTFAKGGAPIKKLTSLANLLKESADLALAGSRVRYDFSLADDLWGVEVDEGQLHQAISNLLINADQAMAEGGTIKIQAHNVLCEEGPDSPMPAGKYVQITITDQGIGIPAKYLDKIFDPYFTTKQKGSGLGLATVYSIIKSHSGHLTVESEVGVGSTFTLYLPALEAGVPVPEKKADEPVRGRGRILVMDDEEVVREVLGKILQRLGYEPHFARDGSQAIEMFIRAKDSGAGFDMVILDLTIRGGMGGEKTVQELLKIDPQIKAIVSSGYCDDLIMAEFEKYGFCGVIAKPYRISELSKVVKQAQKITPSREPGG